MPEDNTGLVSNGTTHGCFPLAHNHKMWYGVCFVNPQETKNIFLSLGSSVDPSFSSSQVCASLVGIACLLLLVLQLFHFIHLFIWYHLNLYLQILTHWTLCKV